VEVAHAVTEAVKALGPNTHFVKKEIRVAHHV